MILRRVSPSILRDNPMINNDPIADISPITCAVRSGATKFAKSVIDPCKTKTGMAASITPKPIEEAKTTDDVKSSRDLVYCIV